MMRFHPALPFLSVAAGIATFSAMDAFMKSAATQTGVYDALLLRSLIGTLIVLPVWLLAGGRWPPLPALKVHALRSAVVVAMALLFFWGLVRLPMAEAMALSFIAPLIALYLAAVLLGERVQPAAILASVFGLAGIAVITAARLQDGSGPDSLPAIGAVLLSACFYAWNLILQRRQALVARPIEVALFQNLFVGAILLPAAPWLLDLPAPSTLRDITAAAALAATALFLLTWGYARAEAQALVPLEYSAFVWAAIAGWLWFGEAMTAATIAGAALIVAGCWIAARKRDFGGSGTSNPPPAP